LSNIEQFFGVGALQDMAVKVRELTPSQTLSVPCPTCGAAIREVCELHSGAPRNEPHRDRKLTAADAIEAKLSERERLPKPLFSFAGYRESVTPLAGCGQHGRKLVNYNFQGIPALPVNAHAPSRARRAR